MAHRTKTIRHLTGEEQGQTPEQDTAAPQSAKTTPALCAARRNVPPAIILLCAVCALLAVLPPRDASAQNPAAIKQALESERDRERQSRANLNRLTKKERALHGDLAKLEDGLDDLKNALRQQERALRDLEAEQRAARGHHARLMGDQENARGKLAELIRALWPLRVMDIHGRGAGDGSWDEADRRFTWGADMYAAADRALKDIRNRAGQIGEAVARNEALRAEAARRLVEINERKDEMLSRRLDFVRGIRKIRAERINEEQALDHILTAIEDLGYRLKNTTARPFAELKGALRAPVEGSMFSAKAARKGARRKGVGFSAADGAPVTAVYWGKVVYNDVLRGFGKVVILFHGDDYYTLYAYLGESRVNQGQEVEKGEPVGTAGFYPAAKGPGLYFELRLGQKAINPVHWLAGQG